MAAIKLDNISYKYPKSDKDIVKDLNCSFDYGILYAIAGPSGSGKTTILSLISGIFKPVSGAVLYENKNIKEIDGAVYRRHYVSTIYQRLNLVPYLTVSENIELCLDLIDYQGDRKKHIDELMQMVKLDSSLKKRLPNKLSGGESQRVAIARCLACDSRVILADEPTGNLDADNADVIITLFKMITQIYNKCVIMVCHDGTLINRADKLYYLKEGKLNE